MTKVFLLVGLLAATTTMSAEPVRVAFYEFGLLYHDGTGLDKDVTEEVGRRLGLKFTAQVMARARIWQDLQSGDLDLTTSAIDSPERSRYAWNVPYLATKNVAIVPARLAGRIKSFNQFHADKTLVWGAVTSFRHSAEQDKWIALFRAEGRLEESADAEALFKKLKDGRIDGLFSSPAIYKQYLSALGMSSAVELQDWSPQETSLTAGFALAKRRFTEADAQRWKATLEAMRNDGTLRAIYSKYLTPTEVEQMLGF